MLPRHMNKWSDLATTKTDSTPHLCRRCTCQLPCSQLYGRPFEFLTPAIHFFHFPVLHNLCVRQFFGQVLIRILRATTRAQNFDRQREHLKLTDLRCYNYCYRHPCGYINCKYACAVNPISKASAHPCASECANPLVAVALLERSRLPFQKAGFWKRSCLLSSSTRMLIRVFGAILATVVWQFGVFRILKQRGKPTGTLNRKSDYNVPHKKIAVRSSLFYIIFL
jgi:hypothetical protein